MSDAVLLGVDWGSSNVRVFAVGRTGAIVESRQADDGVFTASGDYAERLRRHLGGFAQRWPNAPILMCGMIGSDRGWTHAPYVAAPAGIAGLAAALTPVPFERALHIVPGVSFRDGETCEVMRGEETLVAGLVAQAGVTHGTLCLPGTHSKWVDVEGGRIARFRTYMTGELRAKLLSEGSLLTGAEQQRSLDAIEQGRRAAQAGVTNALFQARARRLLGSLEARHTASFVTGVLIGAELQAEAVRRPASIHLLARGAMADDYAAALHRLAVAHTIHDPETLAVHGLLAVAKAAGLAD